jgi:hypothetical protein
VLRCSDEEPGQSIADGTCALGLIGSALCLTAAVQAIVFILHKVRGHGVGTFSSSRPRLAAFLFLVACGAGISIMAESWLRKGVKGNAWPEEDLEPVRRIFDHHIWTVLAYIPVASAFVLPTPQGTIMYMCYRC